MDGRAPMSERQQLAMLKRMERSSVEAASNGEYDLGSPCARTLSFETLTLKLLSLQPVTALQPLP